MICEGQGAVVKMSSQKLTTKKCELKNYLCTLDWCRTGSWWNNAMAGFVPVFFSHVLRGVPHVKEVVLHTFRNRSTKILEATLRFFFEWLKSNESLKSKGDFQR